MTPLEISLLVISIVALIVGAIALSRSFMPASSSSGGGGTAGNNGATLIVKQTADQPLPGNQTVDIKGQVINTASHSIYNPANGVITINEPGIYLATGSINVYPVLPNNGFVQFFTRVNGGPNIGTSQVPPDPAPPGNGRQYSNTLAVFPAKRNDKVEIMAYQNATPQATIASATLLPSYITLTKLTNACPTCL